MADALTRNNSIDLLQVSSRPILKYVFSLEETVSAAISSTFFAEKPLLGRLVAAVLLVSETKLFIFGGLGAILAELLGHQFSQNRSLHKSRLFGLNGFFAGLSAATFLNGYLAPLIAVILMAVVTAFFVVVGHRFLKTWDLPLLVMPFCLTFWSMQFLSHESKVFKLSVGTKSLLGGNDSLQQILYGTLISFGQIVFSSNWIVGAAIAAILLAMHPKKVAEICMSALLPNVIAFLCLGNHWAINSGLTSFSGVLLFQAQRSGFLGISTTKLWFLIGLSGLFEVVSLRIAEIHGVFALPASYIAVFWFAKLGEEVKQGKADKGPATMTW